LELLPLLCYKAASSSPAPDIQQKARMNKREKNEWREFCRAEINKNDPSRLSNIIRRVNEMVEERKAKLSKKSAAAGKRK